MNIFAQFEHDAKLVEQLLWLLMREQTSLIDADIDAVEYLLDEKSRLLQSISASIQARYDALAKLGFEASENGMSSWVEKRGTPEQVQYWKDFQQTLSRAKEMNRLNGQLINKHFNVNQQALNLLQGGQASGVYGANGQAAIAKNISRASVLV
ncbi:MAG TPA: flagellar protein FlgN [Methylophilus sp.]|nr:flagellar protein FlgN [Methylophilus sp.]HQQ32425.1 flagellar protein FlgN [Methylophilus sp.]